MCIFFRKRQVIYSVLKNPVLWAGILYIYRNSRRESEELCLMFADRLHSSQGKADDMVGQSPD